MKRVFQRKPYGPKGDCLRACVASILEKRLREIPNFYRERDSRFWPRYKRFLRKNGIKETLRIAHEWPVVSNLRHKDAYCIVCCPVTSKSGYTKEIGGHAVVGQILNGQLYIVHDPASYVESDTKFVNGKIVVRILEWQKQ